MALNATTLRDAIITALDAEGVYPTPAAKTESETLVGVLATEIVNHIVANAEVSGAAGTEELEDTAGDRLLSDAPVVGTIS